MRAILLAAGMGTRLGEMTAHIPKGMVPFLGKPLIVWQLEALRKAGIEDIIIVAGYRHEHIDFDGITKVLNPKFAETNMVESLLCAREYLDDDFIISYSDIVFEPGLVQALVASEADIAVVGDNNWQDYWKLRLPDSWEDDVESFTADSTGAILDIGLPSPVLENVTHRYVGLIKFTKTGARNLLALYDKKKEGQESWHQSGKEFPQGYMTDLLQELSQAGHPIRLVETTSGWMEFDEISDIRLGENLAHRHLLGTLGCFVMQEELQHMQGAVQSHASDFVENITKFVTHDHDALEVALSDSFDIAETVQVNLKGWSGVSTRSLLLVLLWKLVKKSTTSENLQSLRALQTAFSKYNVLFSVYQNSDIVKGFGPYLVAEDYAMFALCMALFALQEGDETALASSEKAADIIEYVLSLGEEKILPVTQIVIALREAK